MFWENLGRVLIGWVGLGLCGGWGRCLGRVGFRGVVLWEGRGGEGRVGLGWVHVGVGLGRVGVL